MPLESENEPIIKDIFLSIPRRNLVDLLFIDILTIDQAIVLDILHNL